MVERQCGVVILDELRPVRITQWPQSDLVAHGLVAHGESLSQPGRPDHTGSTWRNLRPQTGMIDVSRSTSGLFTVACSYRFGACPRDTTQWPDTLTVMDRPRNEPMMRVPLVDLRAAHTEIADEAELGFKRVLATSSFIGGEEVSALEREDAACCALPHCGGVANGTDALELALRAAGVRAGDEVILPANTFIATAEAVARVGARVVLVDMDPATYLIDVDAALAAVTPATRAVVPVHLYGQLAPVERLTEALAGTPVTVVEDAAQCQGATRHGRGAGSWGIAATSFYPGKNLGAYGDAGAVLSTDPEVATTVRKLANHRGPAKYEHQVIGRHSPLDGLAAGGPRGQAGPLVPRPRRPPGPPRPDSSARGLVG